MKLYDLEKTFIIGEIGINHDGSFEKLMKMIDVAKDSGVDAVKLQVMTGYDLVSSNMTFSYNEKGNKRTVNLAKMFYDRRIKEEWLEKIYNYCEEIGIICFATPFSKSTVDLLESVGNPIYKVSSGDITHLPLIDYIAKKNKPMIVSTGKSTMADIDDAVRTIRNNNNSNFALLHCVSTYPTPYNELNLRIMDTIKSAYQCQTGFSDHSEGYLSSVAAVCMGAKIIEKHFTLDKNASGPDHFFSLDPEELKSLVDSIRLVEKTFGSPVKEVSNHETTVYKRASRSIVASKTINKGDILSSDNLTFKRPGLGIKPKYIDIIQGKKANKRYDEDDAIKWEDF